MKTSIEPCRFVILAAPRTGSNWLCSLLNSHPRVLCHHELFNPEGVHYALDRRETLPTIQPEARDRDPDTFLQEIWHRTEEVDALGFKLNRGQSETAFTAIFADTTITKIILRRRNRIKTFVSETIARQTGGWESYRRDFRLLPSSKVRVEPSDLHRHMRENESYYQELRSRLGAAPCFELSYEDIPTAQPRLLRFLGVEDWPLSSGTIKQNPTALCDLIANFDELKRELPTPLRAELLSTGL